MIKKCINIEQTIPEVILPFSQRLRHGLIKTKLASKHVVQFDVLSRIHSLDDKCKCNFQHVFCYERFFHLLQKIFVLFNLRINQFLVHGKQKLHVQNLIYTNRTLSEISFLQILFPLNQARKKRNPNKRQELTTNRREFGDSFSHNDGRGEPVRR